MKILIADDHGVMRRGLRLQLEQCAGMTVAGEAADGRAAVKLAAELRPDIVIIDIAMPLLNGIEAASQILAADPKTGVIILSMHSDEEYLLRALSAGARGYLLKENADADLERAVRAVAAGKSYFSDTIQTALREDYVRQLRQRGLEDSYNLLTEREREVLQLLAEGKSNKEAASVLDCSVNTVASHRLHLMQKLDLHSAADIVLYAVRKKIIA